MCMQEESMNQTLENLKELVNGELKNCEVSNCSDQVMIVKRVLCPNIVMNERHKMARNQSKPLQAKLFPTPSELKFMAANKLNRDENSKILLREKEKRFITKAIIQVEREFSNRRNSATLALPDLENPKKLINSHVCEVLGKEDKNTGNDSSINFLTDIQKAYKKLFVNISRVQYFQEHLPEKQQTTSPARRNQNIIKLSPVTPKEKSNTNNNKNEKVGNAADEKTNQNEKSEKLELVQSMDDNKSPSETTEETFELLDVKAPTQNCDNNVTSSAEQSRKWKMLYCWTIWRMVTLKSKKENHKLTRIKKIDSFLARLTETAEQVQRLEELAESVSCQASRKNSKEFSLSRKRRKSTCETEDTRKLDEMEKEIIESSTYACERLQKNLKNFHPNLLPKLKALSVLTNARNKYKSFSTEPRRVYPTPAFLLEMENRYNERKKRWENIRKRRSEMEAEKERIMREREEEAKKMEDLKKKEKLEELKEKRRRENEAKEERKRERNLLKQQLSLANDHYNRYLLKKVGFQSWTRLIETRRNQMKTAHHHSEVRLCRTLLMNWRQFTASQIERKLRKAQELYEKILLRNSLRSWMLKHGEYVQKTQVAVDWAEAKLSEKTFAVWLDNARAEHWHFMHKMEIAEIFHERKMLTRCLKKWENFPELVRNEKEKEKRKKLWQRKVQEFLPDYQPAPVSEISRFLHC